MLPAVKRNRYQVMSQLIETEQISAAGLCRAFAVSPSGFYAWKRGDVSQFALGNSPLAQRIGEIFWQHKRRYGARRIQAQLVIEGFSCSRWKVSFLMKKLNLVAIRKGGFRCLTKQKPGLPYFPNLLKIKAFPQKPNQIWAADISEISCLEGKTYLSLILDLFSRKIISYKLSKNMHKSLVINNLYNAVKQRKTSRGVIFHSDRGSQYNSIEFRCKCAFLGLRQSMSGRGNCYDNAFVESLFSTIKSELIELGTFTCRADAQSEIFAYMQYYNRDRLHSSLGYRSPQNFENQALLPPKTTTYTKKKKKKIIQKSTKFLTKPIPQP